MTVTFTYLLPHSNDSMWEILELTTYFFVNNLRTGSITIGLLILGENYENKHEIK